MLGYLKAIGAGLFVASLIIFGFKVATWRADAALLEVARLELRNELQRRVKSDADKKTARDERDAARAQLSELHLKNKEAEIVKNVKAVKETVVKYVKINPDCDLPEPVAGQLQKLREGGE